MSPAPSSWSSRNEQRARAPVRHTYAGQAAIVGIGATEFSKNSGRSELQLALEACAAACDDAGGDPKQVNGLSTFTMETHPESESMRGPGIAEPTHLTRV